MIPAETTITFDCTGRTNTLLPLTQGQARQDIVNELLPFFTVLNVTVGASSYIPSALSDWDYTASITITTRIDYGLLDDIRSVVAHACYAATGGLPTVTARDWETSQDPATTNPGLDIASGIRDLLDSIIKPVAQPVQGLALILVVGIVAIVALLAFGSQTGKVAKALRP